LYRSLFSKAVDADEVFKMALLSPEDGELVVSSDLQPRVDKLRRRGWSKQAILNHLAGGPPDYACLARNGGSKLQ
jgi:hypothetical protein